MPRTRAKSKKDPNDPPLYRWEKLQLHDKVICYNYYQFTATLGAEGWNPTAAGSVDHYRASTWIQSLGSSSWFRHRAKLMVTLAEVFAKRNEAPPNPNLDGAVAAAATAATTAPAPAPAPAPVPAPATVPPRPQPNPEAFTAASTRPVGMNSPNPRTRGGTPSRAGTPAPSVAGSAGIPTEVQVSEADSENLGISCPTAFGAHDKFDYGTRRLSKHILARTLLHSAVTLEDITFLWLTPRRLKFDIAWPDFFTQAERMAALTTDGNNHLIFPAEHALTMDIAQRNQNLVSDDGKVWDDGVFSFEQDMKQDNPIIELIDIHIAERNISVKCLQLYAE